MAARQKFIRGEVCTMTEKQAPEDKMVEEYAGTDLEGMLRVIENKLNGHLRGIDRADDPNSTFWFVTDLIRNELQISQQYAAAQQALADHAEALEAENAKLRATNTALETMAHKIYERLYKQARGLESSLFETTAQGIRELINDTFQKHVYDIEEDAAQ